MENRPAFFGLAKHTQRTGSLLPEWLLADIRQTFRKHEWNWTGLRGPIQAVRFGRAAASECVQALVTIPDPADTDMTNSIMRQWRYPRSRFTWTWVKGKGKQAGHQQCKLAVTGAVRPILQEGAVHSRKGGGRGEIMDGVRLVPRPLVSSPPGGQPPADAGIRGGYAGRRAGHPDCRAFALGPTLAARLVSVKLATR